MVFESKWEVETSKESWFFTILLHFTTEEIFESSQALTRTRQEHVL